MKTFKLYFKITRKYISQFVIQILIFIAIFFALVMSFGQDQKDIAEVDKVPVAVFNEDTKDEITKSLLKSIEPSTTLVSIKEDQNSISDALFFEEAKYILKIPKGFGQALREGKEDQRPIETLKAMDEGSVTVVESQIKQFFTLYKANQLAEGGSLSTEKEAAVLQNIEKSFQDRIKITYFGQDNNRQITLVSTFFKIMSYYLFAASIAQIGFTMVAMDNKNIIGREIASGYPQIKRSLGLYFASLIVVLLLWIISVLVGFFFFKGEYLTSTTTQLFILSSFVHMIAVGSIAIFLGTIAPNKGFINFASTVFSLFIGFSSGVFIQKDLVWEPMKNFAYFFPSIWHTDLLDEIRKTTGSIDWNLFIKPFAVQVLMATAFLLLSLAYRRRKQFKGLS